MKPQVDAGALQEVSALIEYILERFHEPHRQVLPDLIQQAQALGEPAAAMAQHLSAMADDLEAHMFKEEMRLFPMIQQGGGSLLGQLVDDMSREHRRHEADIEHLQTLMSALRGPPQTEAAQGALVPSAALLAGVYRFVHDLREHMALEDQQLFARFDHQPRLRRP